VVDRVQYGMNRACRWLVVASTSAAGLIVLSCSTARVESNATPDETSPPATLGRVTMEQAGAPLGVGRAYAIPPFTSIDGVRADAESVMRGKSVVVVAMTSSGCPVSQKYGPRMASIEREFGPRGVGFVHVNTVAAESDAEIREQIKDAGFRGMYAPDRDRALARVLRPRTTSEVYVFDSTWTLRYRGALDDQYGVGVALESPRRHFLRDAIDAVLRKQTPTVAATWAPGCLVDPPDSVGGMLAGGTPVTKPKAAPAGVTYYGRIAHLLDAHCVECHRTNGPGPFNLASATSIEGRAAMIAAVVREGLMPPSHGEETSRPPSGWKSPATMNERDRADLLGWLASDRPQGNPSEAPRPNPRAQGWALGTPDQILMTPTMRLPAEGPLMHQRQAIPTALAADQWITAIDVRPMKQGTIQHAIAWVVPAGVAAPRSEQELASVAGVELLAAYSPGHGLVRYPPGSARRFRAGSTVVVDAYARPMGKAMGVAVRIGLHTLPAGETPVREVRTMSLIARAFEIAAGEASAVRRVEGRVGEGGVVLSMTPGMGPRGRRVRLVGITGSGEASALLSLDRYDWRWQIRYEPAGEIALAPGSTLALEGAFDNSEKNASNPTPGRAAKSGVGPTEEALWMGVEYLVGTAGGR
jgi:mono/diheme cytochrome c family protein